MSYHNIQSALLQFLIATFVFQAFICVSRGDPFVPASYKIGGNTVELPASNVELPIGRQSPSERSHSANRFFPTITPTRPKWKDVRKTLLSAAAVWPQIFASSIMHPAFSPPSGPPLRNRTVSDSREADRNPPLLIDHLKSLEYRDDLAEFEDKADFLSDNRDIIRFWDDPVCETFVFPSGLRVCGDARIRGMVTLLSGMNASAAIDRWSGDGYRKPPAHIYRRCIFDRDNSRPAEGETVINAGNEPRPFTNSSRSSTRPQLTSSRWCIGSLLIRSANIVVMNSIEIGGTLYARSVRVDAGSSLLVGLRGLFYGNDKLTGVPFETLASASQQSELDKPTLKKLREYNRQHLSALYAETFEPIHSRRRYNSRFSEKRRREPWRSQIRIPKADVIEAECPLVGAAGTILNMTEPTDDRPAFGHKLPLLSINETIGDLVTQDIIVVENAAVIWVFGNVVGSGVIAEDGAEIHSHCGHYYMNITSEVGLTILSSSVASAGGHIESITPRVAVQHASSFISRPSLMAAAYVQAFKSSVVYLGGELLTSLMSVSEGSLFELSGDEVNSEVADIAEASMALVHKHFRVKALQVLDGSTAIFNGRSGVKADGDIVVDGSSRLYTPRGPLVTERSFHASNRSIVSIRNSLTSRDTARIVASDVWVGGDFRSRASLLIGVGSSVFIRGSVSASGVTAGDVNMTDVEDSKVQRRNRTASGGAGSDSNGAVSIVGENAQKNVISVGNPATPRKLDLQETGLDNTARRNWTALQRDREGVETAGPRPALFVESSDLLVAGRIDVINSWIDVTRNARLIVDAGLNLLSPRKSLIQLRHDSRLVVQYGNLLGGLSLSVLQRSQAEVRNGSLIVSNLEIMDRSGLSASMAEIGSDIWVSGRSLLDIREDVVIHGALVSVDSRSVMRCSNLRQRHGDVFVEGGSLLDVHSGNLWALGSVVAQDRGAIRIGKGSLVVAEGDVVSENFASVKVYATILVFSAYRRIHERQQRDGSNKKFATGGGVGHPPSVAKNLSSTAQLIDQPSGAGDRIQLLHDDDNIRAETMLIDTDSSRTGGSGRQGGIFVPAGVLRRTKESVVMYDRVIPSNMQPIIYVQQLPDYSASSSDENQGSNETGKETGEYGVSKETLKQDRESRVNITRALKKPKSWEMLQAVQESRLSLNKSQARNTQAVPKLL